jgi:hypothetical protein
VYSLVKSSCIYYKKIMGSEEYRGNLADPILLLGDVNEFNKARNDNSPVYNNLCTLIFKIKELYESG